MNQGPVRITCKDRMAPNLLWWRRRRASGGFFFNSRFLELLRCLREEPRTTGHDKWACMAIRKGKTTDVVETRERIRCRYSRFCCSRRNANKLPLSNLVAGPDLTPGFIEVDLKGRRSVTECVHLIPALFVFFSFTFGCNSLKIIPCCRSSNARFMWPLRLLRTWGSDRPRVAESTQRIIRCMSYLRRGQGRY